MIKTRNVLGNVKAEHLKDVLTIGLWFLCVCVFVQAAEMVEDEVDPDSQSWGSMRGESEKIFSYVFSKHD